MDKSKYFAAAEKAAQKGQNDKALEAFEAILKADPSDLKALSRAADLHLKEEHFEKGIEYLKRIGEAYTKDGFHSKAAAIFKRILKIDKIPNRAVLIETHEKMASLYGQLGLISDAMGHFAIVVDYYDQIGDQASLLNVLKKVSDLDPENIDNQLRLVDLFMAQSRLEEALETLSQIESATRAKNSVADLARVYEKMIDHFPKDLEKLKALVDILIKANEPKRALARIQHSFKLDPKNPDILELLSSTFLALKQPDKAKAVDTELMKLYRQLGNEVKASEVEARVHHAASRSKNFQTDSTRRILPSDLSEPTDPVESLISALPLSAEERKILAECDVYFKYGLAEKAYEVIRSRLSEFPQSLVIRWKLKVSTQDLKKIDETAHLLSEIILLARKQNLEIWANLAVSELRAIDPGHPTLRGAADEKVSPKAAPISETKIEESTSDGEAFHVDESELSIVVEDEFDENAEDVSEISFKDLEISEVKPAASKPEVQEVEVSADEFAMEEEPDTIVLADEPIEIDEPRMAETAGVQPPAIDLAESADHETSDILSEADFTIEELEKFDGQVLGEAETPSAQKNPAQKLKAAADEVALEIAAEVEPFFESTPEIVEPEVIAVATTPELSPDFEIKQGLEEVEFFESQGLISDAQVLIKNLLEKFPNSPELQSRSATLRAGKSTAAENIKKKSLDVETLGRKVKFNVQEDERADDGDFFDLAAELNSEFQETEHQGPAEIRDVFAAFKKGIESTIGKEDWQTHLDLGIAYREMGLLDDALQEFAIVGSIPEQKVSALYQMGLTKMAMEKFQEAEKLFADALKDPKVQSQEKLSLTYELGEVLVKLNRKDKARTLFEEILKQDPEFREVSERIKALA